MFKALLIYALTIGAIVAGIAVTMRVPLDTALGVFAIGEVAVLSVAIPVLVVRLKPKRKPRNDWQHLSADHADRLPTPRAVAEIVAPQTSKEIDYARNVRQLPSQTVHLLAAPTDHRDRRAAD